MDVSPRALLCPVSRDDLNYCPDRRRPVSQSKYQKHFQNPISQSARLPSPRLDRQDRALIAHGSSMNGRLRQAVSVNTLTHACYHCSFATQ